MKTQIITILLLLIATFLNGQSLVYNTKTVANDREKDDYFGQSVDLSDSFAIIGVPKKNKTTHLLEAGAVYIFKKEKHDKWTQLQKITEPYRIRENHFGHAVGIQGNYMVVGSPGKMVHSNSVHGNKLMAGGMYIYKRGANNIWELAFQNDTTLTNEFDGLGSSVAIYDKTILAGSPGHDYNKNDTHFIENAGAVFHYKQKGNGDWKLHKKITSPERAKNNNFGTNVFVSDKYALISASGDNTNENYKDTINAAGAVFVYKLQNNSWVFEQKLVPSKRHTYMNFGNKAIMYDSFIIVSASFDKTENSNSTGAIYIFKKDLNGKWIEDQKLVSKHIQANLNLANGVCIANKSIVATSNIMYNFHRYGALHVFNRSKNGKWVEDEIVKFDTLSYSSYTNSLASYNNTILAGCPGMTLDQNSKNQKYMAGSASFYTLLDFATIPPQKINCKIYPNPIQASFNIELDKVYETVEVRVLNSHGQTLFSSKYKNTSYITSQISGPKGLYFVEVVSDDQHLFVEKIFKIMHN